MVRKTNIILRILIFITIAALPAEAVLCFEDKTAGETIEESESSCGSVISDELIKLYREEAPDAQKVVVWLNQKNSESEENEYLSDIRQEYEELCLKKEQSSDEAKKAEEYMMLLRNAKAEEVSEYVNKFSGEFFAAEEVLYKSNYTEMIIAELSEERAKALAEKEEVTLIEPYYEMKISKESLDSRDSGNRGTIQQNLNFCGITQALQNNLDGTGIKIGVYDVDDPDVGSYPLNTHTIYTRYDNPATGTHATAVLQILTAIAPEATYFYTKMPMTGVDSSGDLNTQTIDSSFYDGIEWLLSMPVVVMNFSFGVVLPNALSSYTYIDRYYDRISDAYAVTIVKSAGNKGSLGITHGGMAYNVITVGNYDTDTASINPTSGYFSGIGLAKKPDLCATGSYTFSDCLLDGSGTSFSTPTVAGSIALLMEADSTLKTRNYLVKSILSSSVNSTVHHYVPMNSDYRYYGAGILNAGNAYDVITEGDYLFSTMSADASFNTHYVLLERNKTTRIALSYRKEFDENDVEYEIADLNLYVYDTSGTLISSSNTANNNIEIVEFDTSYTGWYTVKVFNSVAAMDDNGEETSSLYGLSWSQE